MTEIIAEYYRINRLTFYDYDHFITLIKDKYHHETHQAGGVLKNWTHNPALLDKLPEALKRIPLSMKAFKVPLLLKLLETIEPETVSEQAEE